jgi:class 3 adenylate cyclase
VRSDDRNSGRTVEPSEPAGIAATPPRSAPTLLILDGALAGRRVPVDDELVVGRDEDGLYIDDGEISRRHACFRRRGEVLEVRDLGSLNGTWVNGAMITASTHLVTDDVVRVGRTRIKVLNVALASPDSPMPKPDAPVAAAMDDASQQDELRPITALFADIADSTSIGERFEPEEVKTLVGDCVTKMSRIIEEFGGVIDAYMGDGLAAFFGFPTAHEDDAERAARAALRIVEAVGHYAEEVRATWSLPSFNVRLGVNSGQVAVGFVGGAARRPVALGDTMNVAARLQSVAAPGTILVGGRTAQKLRHRFVLEPLGPIVVRGRDATVDAWRLVRAQTTTQPAESSSLVGREDETQRLSAALEALLSGSGQVVLLAGEAGLGKTRLLESFRSFARDRAVWLEGHCRSYDAALSYAPFAEILHRWLGVDEADSAALIRAQLERKLEQLLGPELPNVLPYLASLLSLQADPESDAKIKELPPDRLGLEIRRAYCTWARALGEAQPLIIALEDLHWADEMTLELAESVLQVVDSAPVAVAATFRLGSDAKSGRFRDKALAAHPHRTHELRLTPLSEAESAQLLAERSPQGLDENVQRDLIGSAEGNPLFLEQLLQFFLESGERARRRTWSMTAVRHEVPSGLESLLIARMDALPAKARRVVQVAAVIGREFSLLVVEAVTGTEHVDDIVAVLVRAGIIRELRPPPETEYEFTHGLLREAALSTLPRARRREIYRTVATMIERLFESSLDEHLPQLAFFNARAGDLPRALWYIEQAAARATEVHASVQAAELWQRAASIADKVGDVDAQRRISSELQRLGERHG